jgi:hypothetical protein
VRYAVSIDPKEVGKAGITETEGDIVGLQILGETLLICVVSMHCASRRGAYLG